MKTIRPKIDVETTCTCGQCSIKVAGAIHAMFLCACTECQKQSGAGHIGLSVIKKSSITPSGDYKTIDRKADSGSTITRYVCPTCAGTLFAHTSRFDNIALLPTGIFDDQSWFDPQYVIFARSKRHWDNFGELPTFQAYPEEEQ